MQSILFEGIATALITPFKEDQSLDLEGLKILIDFQIENGISAIIIAGTTGEASTLSFEEYSLLIAKSNEFINKRVPLIAGSGSNNTAHALKLSLEAEKRGADGLLIVTPYYNKTTQAGLIAHYRHIADRVRIPIILYNVPGRTGLSISPETCKALSIKKNIIGIKEASGSISATIDISKSAPNLALYSGNDDQLLPITAIGGKGLISVASNVIPKEMTEIYQNFKQGDTQKAILQFKKVLPLIRGLFNETNPIPVKKVLSLLGYPAGDPRLPLIPCSAETEKLLRAAIKEAGL